MRWLLRYVLPLLIALPLGFLLLYPQLLRCMRIGQSADFRLLTDPAGVYVSRTTNARQQAQLSRHVRTARDRISRFWGGWRSSDRHGTAILIYCPNQTEYEQYCVGGEGAGCSLGLPWGASYLVLGPEGNNADVIAHELCHDELFARLGWWRIKRQIPVWFNEGLALMVDYRFSNPAVWELSDSTTTADDIRMPLAHGSMLKLSDLETTRDFFGGDYDHVMRAYQTAADEVTRWLLVAGRSAVPMLADSVANGRRFDDVYRQLERQRKASGRP